VPADLAARLIAAIPAEMPRDKSQSSRDSRSRHRFAWSGVAVAMAATIVLAVLLWPGAGEKGPRISVVAQPATNDSTNAVTPDSGDIFNITPSLEFRRRFDSVETPSFTWPIQEKSPLMVSSAIPRELLD